LDSDFNAEAELMSQTHPYRSSAVLMALVAILAIVSVSCSPDLAREPVRPEVGEGAADWPPRLGEPYPDLTLKDPTGREVRLSEFKGRVLLVEPIGIDCPACQAFAGGNRPEVGPFRTCRPQQGLQSIGEYVEQYGGGITLDDPRLVYVQLLLYDWSRTGPPSLEDARQWAEHFGEDRRSNQFVLVGDEDLITQASYDMIPGFQLIDADFVLRVDSTGHHPRHNLWSELLPRLGEMVQTVRVGTRVGEPMRDFALDDGDGNRVEFSELRGTRPAFVFFYSGCCGHCSEQLPRVAEFAESLEQRETAVVGVQYRGDSESCRRVSADLRLPGTILADSDGSVCGQFGVGDFTVFSVDAEGIIRYRGKFDSDRI
jgi:peroxiredoxin